MMKRACFFGALILCLLPATHTALAQQASEDNSFEVGGQLVGIDMGPLESIITFQGMTIRRDQFDVGYVGVGGRFGYNFNRFLSIEAEGNFFPERNFNEVEQSRKAQFLAGLKAGIRTEKFGVFAKARPGLMYFSSIPAHERCTFSPITPTVFTSTTSCVQEKQTNFAFDVGGVVEYYPTSRIIIRLDLGDTLVHFKETGPTPNFGSSVFTPANTTHNFQCSIGFGIRF
jgi:opacity protein-like surface antigen